LEIKRGSSRKPYVAQSLWKKLWTCRETDYVMNVPKLRDSIQIVMKFSNTKFHKSPTNGSSADNRGQILYGRTGMTNLIGAFREYVNAPNNENSTYKRGNI
jgi:hypothetical protein